MGEAKQAMSREECPPAYHRLRAAVGDKCGETHPFGRARCERAAGHGSDSHWGWTESLGGEPAFVTWRVRLAGGEAGSEVSDGR